MPRPFRFTLPLVSALAALGLAAGLAAGAAPALAAPTAKTPAAIPPPVTTAFVTVPASATWNVTVKLTRPTAILDPARTPDPHAYEFNVKAGTTDSISTFELIQAGAYVVEASYSQPGTGRAVYEDVTVIAVKAGGSLTLPITPRRAISAPPAGVDPLAPVVAATPTGRARVGYTLSYNATMSPAAIALGDTVETYWASDTAALGTGPSHQFAQAEANRVETQLTVVDTPYGHYILGSRFRVWPKKITLKDTAGMLKPSVTNFSGPEDGPGLQTSITWYRSGKAVSTRSTPLTRHVTKSLIGKKVRAVITVRGSATNPTTKFKTKAITVKKLYPSLTAWYASFRDGYRDSRKVVIGLGDCNRVRLSGMVMIKWGAYGTTTYRIPGKLALPDYADTMTVRAPAKFFNYYSGLYNGRITITYKRAKVSKYVVTTRTVTRTLRNSRP
ncbi:MAG: hypothetical protein LBM66_03085 [Bifidobacteriaceae bacterium]|jgi:hypothetical protein|nr:hypothetical protein [Bifidobacteriaceae bacterium]